MTQMHAPGPRSWLPTLGPMWSVWRFAREPLWRMQELFDRYGDIVSLDRTGSTRIFSSRENCTGTVFVRGPDNIEIVETDSQLFHRSAVSGSVFPHRSSSGRKRNLLDWGTGLFAVNDAEHLRLRRLLGPAFGRSRIQAQTKAVVEIVNRCVDSWEHGAIIDIHSMIKDLTLRIVSMFIFGREFGLDSRLARAQIASLASVISPLVLLAQYDFRGLPYSRFLDNVAILRDESLRIIREQRSSGEQGDGLLAAMMSGEAELSDPQIVGHLGVFLAAGHETTAFAISAALLLLALHPDVAHEVAEEVRADSRGGFDDPTQMRRLPALAGVINEVLRLLPPAPWTARETTASTELSGVKIATGTEVIPAIFHTHRLPAIWDEPACFRPHRWRKIRPSPYEFNPFGGGSRICIGRTFAQFEMSLILSTILSRFGFDLVAPTVDPCMSVTMSFRAPLMMRVQKGPNWGTRNVAAEGGIRRYVHLDS